MTGTAVRFAMRRVERAASADEAKQRWLQGRVVPHRITAALDISRLDGPDVDEACGVLEPAVDRWERGTLYPTWEQLLRLAVLTGFDVAFFTTPVDDEPMATNIRWRPHEGGPVYGRTPTPVLAFTQKAIRRTLGSRYVCHECGQRR
jgi:hypothetical protein